MTSAGAMVAAIGSAIVFFCSGFSGATRSVLTQINAIFCQWQPTAIFIVDFVMAIFIGVRVYVIFHCNK
jgi:hypothetical protein